MWMCVKKEGPRHIPQPSLYGLAKAVLGTIEDVLRQFNWRELRGKSGDYREMLSLIRNTMQREGISRRMPLLAIN
jgi:hypothetical protein